MPQPSHVMALDTPDESTLPEDLQPYFQKALVGFRGGAGSVTQPGRQ